MSIEATVKVVETLCKIIMKNKDKIDMSIEENMILCDFMHSQRKDIDKDKLMYFELNIELELNRQLDFEDYKFIKFNKGKIIEQIYMIEELKVVIDLDLDLHLRFYSRYDKILRMTGFFGFDKRENIFWYERELGQRISEILMDHDNCYLEKEMKNKDKYKDKDTDIDIVILCANIEINNKGFTYRMY